MWTRRAFFVIQFGAAIVLPLWLLIGRGLIVDGPGWEFVLLLFVCPILALGMLAVAGLTTARKSVRSMRAVSWLDVGILSAWYASIVGAGLVAHTAVAVVVVLVSVGSFWAALWQLFSETRNRVRTVMASFDRTAVPAGEYEASRRAAPYGADADRIIRIDPPRE